MSEYSEGTRLIQDDVLQDKSKTEKPLHSIAGNGTAKSTATTPGANRVTSPTANGDDSPVSVNSQSLTQTKPVLYWRRWLILLLFCCYSACNAFQWNCYAIIQDIIIDFYRPCLPASAYGQAMVVTWLSMIFFVGYVICIIPATWLLDQYGLRVTVMLGAGLNALGAAIKCASVGRSLISVVYVGQVICSISQVFLLGLPAHIAGTWFGENEVSTATAIGVFGNQVGIALGFLIPPLLVPQTKDVGEISRGLAELNYFTAGIAVSVFLIILIAFKEKPQTPPSRAQAMATISTENQSFSQTLKILFTNMNFVFLTLSYGILTGVFYGVSLLISPIVGAYIENADALAGRLGLVMVIAGIFGSVLAGVWLDKSKMYRLTTLLCNAFSVVGMLAFTFTLRLKQEWLMYATIGILGFFMTGYLPIGFEFAAEITYPEAEGTSSGMLNMSAQFFGIVITIGMQYFISAVSAFAANIAFSVTALAALIFAVFVKSDLRRLQASKNYAINDTYSSTSSVDEPHR